MFVVWLILMVGALVCGIYEGAHSPELRTRFRGFFFAGFALMGGIVFSVLVFGPSLASLAAELSDRPSRGPIEYNPTTFNAVLALFCMGALAVALGGAGLIGGHHRSLGGGLDASASASVLLVLLAAPLACGSFLVAIWLSCALGGGCL